MKRTIAALFICLLIAGGGYAADPDVEIRLDISQQDKPFPLKVHQADTPLVRARLYNNGVKWTASDLNWSGQFGYGTNYENSASLVTVQGGTAATNDNYIDFQFTATDVNTNGIFFAQVLLTNSATSRRYTFGDGRITIKKNPIGGSANPLVLVNMPSATVNGTIAYYSTNVSPNAWVILAPGTNGYFLQTRDTNLIPQWALAAVSDGAVTNIIGGLGITASGVGCCWTIIVDVAEVPLLDAANNYTNDQTFGTITPSNVVGYATDGELTTATNDNFVAATNAAKAYTDQEILLQLALDGIRPMTGDGDGGGNAWTNLKSIVLDGTVVGLYAATDSDTFGVQAHFGGPGILFRGTNHATKGSEVSFVNNAGGERLVFDGDDGSFDFKGSSASNFNGVGITNANHGTLTGLSDTNDHSYAVYTNDNRSLDLSNASLLLVPSPSGGNDNEAATTRFVEDSVGGNAFRYYLQNTTNSDPNTFRNLTASSADLNASRITNTFANVTNNQTLITWITPADEPHLEEFLAGTYSLQVHATKTSGNKDLSFRAVISGFDVGSNLTTIVNTETWEPVLTTNAETHIAVHALRQDDLASLTNDRVRVDLITVVTGSGGQPTVQIIMEGDTDARVVINVPNSTFAVKSGDLDQFVNAGSANEVFKGDGSGGGAWGSVAAGEIPAGGIFLAGDAGAFTNLPSDVAFHIERPTNAVYNIKWLYCTPVNMVLTRLMGKTEAGLVQGHIIESATNSWNIYTTNLVGFSIGAGGVASTEYTSFADATVEQWKWVGIQITNDTSSTTNFSGTIHAIR